MKYTDILGNEKVKDILKKAVQHNTVLHSYLFVGEEGIGKSLFAKEFAKSILCLGKEKPCEACKSCIEIEENNQPDYIEIVPDGNSIKIEQIRNMQLKVAEKPIVSTKKVYVIQEADTMTQEAQNALLKTLEEPPEYATIILIGNNENAFLNTIKSRCMIINFKPIDKEKIQQYMEQNYQMYDLHSNMLDAFQGSIGKAIQLKDKKEQYEKVEETIEKLDKKDIIDIISMSEDIYKDKDEIANILEYIEIILLKLAQKEVKYANCIRIVEDTKKRLSQNANYDMCIDNMIFNMWEEVI